jgi:hypothetical protein
MNCPHCQRPVDDNYTGVSCPVCGGVLPSSSLSGQSLFQPHYVNWRRFYIVLLLPPVCCFVSIALKMDILAGIFGIVGSLVSGLICSRMLGVIFLLRRRKILAGQHFHIYLMAYGIFRFGHEFLRDTPRIAGPLSGYQIAALGVATLGAAGFIRRQQSNYHCPPPLFDLPISET